MTTPSLDSVRVVVADDAALIRHAVTTLLVGAGAQVVGEAADGPALRAAVNETVPDLVVTDIRMPPGGTEGLAAAVNIQLGHPEVAILLLSNHAETRYLRRLIDHARAGVGYLLKERVAHVDEFVEAVQRVLGGGISVDPEVAALLVTRTFRRQAMSALTARERDVLTEIATGASNVAIGRHLRLSIKTVETHIQKIFEKLDLYQDIDNNRRVQAVLALLQS